MNAWHTITEMPLLTETHLDTELNVSSQRKDIASELLAQYRADGEAFLS
jgi:hypothetical protein